jgi:glyoxylase-like metal-dependent hydrolase (beta-lactamase superfamily II)
MEWGGHFMRHKQKHFPEYTNLKPILFKCYFVFFIFFPAIHHAQETEHFETIELSKGVYVVTHSIGGLASYNYGLVDLGKKTLLFDTSISLKTAKELKKISDQIAFHQIDCIINSHYHNDHIRGNQVFGPAADIISTDSTRTYILKYEPDQIRREGENVPKRLIELKKAMESTKDNKHLQELKILIWEYQAIAESHPKQKITPPNITFENNLNIYGTKRRAVLTDLGGHTASDIIMYLPEDKIVFTGDLVFVGCHPYLGDGNYKDLLSSLNKLKNMDIKVVVPGHGSVGTKEDVNKMIDYVEMVYNLSKEYAIKGKTIDELLSSEIPAPFDSWYIQSFFKDNLEFLYGVAAKEKK